MGARSSSLLWWSLAFPVLSAQQDPEPDTFGHSRHGAEFDEGPRQAAHRIAGLNPNVHFPVAWLLPDAQGFFDQGICQQHGFWYFESERSFRQVARMQPDCALAYWGMCVANVENHQRAAGFIAQAVQRAAALPERERAWVDAWAKFHQITDEDRTALQSGDQEKVESTRKAIVERSKTRDEKRLGRDLVRDLEAIVARHPGDPEAKAFLIVQIWRNTEAGLEITSHGAVDALLDQLFALAPMHPAHHFRVHLWDHEKAERALASAAVLGHTAPGIAHQWHMGGHIFAQLDRHADAAWQQEASARVDHAHMQRDRVLPYEIHNYGHNQEWLCRSLMHIGKGHAALELAKNLVELPRHPKMNRVAVEDDIAGYGRQRLIDVLLAFEMWDQAIACCDNGFLEPTDDLRDQAKRLQLLGTAQFRLGRQDRGVAAVDELQQLLVRARAARAAAIDQAEDAAWQRGDDAAKVATARDEAAKAPTERVREIQRTIAGLRGEQALAAGDGKLALEQFGKAENATPAAKALAQQLLGEHGHAIEELEKALKPGRALPLARLVRALWLGDRKDDAKAKFEQLRQLAGAADLEFPPLAALADIARELGMPADWRLPQPVPKDAGERPPLDQLGPFRWSPVPAPATTLPQIDGGTFTLAERRRPTLLVFYLGFGCLHCVEQLRALAPRAKDFAAAGIDIVAIGSDDVVTAAGKYAALAEADRFPFPLACDPGLQAFQTWRAYDDFEAMPLHSTILLDADGRIRWQDISYQPFTELEWLLAECRRLLALPMGTGAGSK